jgi:hypothetical protein
MKILLLIGFASFLLSPKAYSQQITPGELIGVWDKTDTTKEKISFKFIDNSNLNVEKSGAPNKFSYKLIEDSLAQGQIILLEMEKDGIKQLSSYSIERINKSVLKLVNRDNYMNSVELPRETTKGIFFLARRK